MAEEGVSGLYRGGQYGIENYPMTLVVVGPTAVHAKVEVVDWRTEEEFTDVIDRVRPGVGETRRSPRRGALTAGVPHPRSDRPG